MKHIILLLILSLSIPFYGQKGKTYESYNKFTQMLGTPYVVAQFSTYAKFGGHDNSHLLFINTLSGESNKLTLPNNGKFLRIKQVKIDSLSINIIIASCQTVERNGKSGYDWGDPRQIFILTTEGKIKKQLTESDFDVQHWECNHQTGTLVVSGKYDSNSDGKINKYDKPIILLYDLKTLELIKKI